MKDNKFNEFTDKVLTHIKEFYGEGYKVKLCKVNKNNGNVLTGITILQDGTNVSPTIYLDYYYDSYCEGMTMSEIIKAIVDINECHRIKENVNIEFFEDFNKVKSNIFGKLINREKNEELLKDCPHIDYLDLSVVFYYLILNEDFGTASVLIHNCHSEMWNKSSEELYEVAMTNNTSKKPYVVKSLLDIVREMNDSFVLDENGDSSLDSLLPDETMYVLTTNNKIYGAICLKYPDVLEKFGQKCNSNFYVLPSSIHELILLPEDKASSINELKRMVCEVNENEVPREDILSDSVYYYDRESKELSITA